MILTYAARVMYLKRLVWRSRTPRDTTGHVEIHVLLHRAQNSSIDCFSQDVTHARADMILTYAARVMYLKRLVWRSRTPRDRTGPVEMHVLLHRAQNSSIDCLSQEATHVCAERMLRDATRAMYLNRLVWRSRTPHDTTGTAEIHILLHRAETSAEVYSSQEATHTRATIR